MLRTEDNLGVAAGRNLAATAAHSDVLVFIDDDAVLTTPILSRLSSHFTSDAKLAVTSFKIVRSDRSQLHLEYPFRWSVKKSLSPERCAYFLGGACAIRRSDFLAAGQFDDGFFYSTEELDLSFRFVKRGNHLLYDPLIVVEHRPSQIGRLPSPRLRYYRMRNRILVARRYLPGPVVAIHVAVWTMKLFVGVFSDRSIKHWWHGFRSGWHSHVNRRPLSLRQAIAAYRLGGRILW